jgi:LysR family transcriptional regulator, chromosome initiation inhibitor
MNIDYKLLKALSAVIATQSFEAASFSLNISQSAVSQRIKLLEEFVGHPVLIRSKPIELTEIGQLLINHYKQVELLERELIPSIQADNPQSSVRLSLSVNADSLSIWFIQALSPLLRTESVELDIHVLDENRTTQKLKSGEAFGALSTTSHPAPGYKTEYVGDLNYILVASPDYQTKYFTNGVTKSSLRTATGISYDQMDSMHIDFIQQNFGLFSHEYPRHHVRSSESFVDLAKCGVAYTLLPELQIQSELNSGELVNLLPNRQLTTHLYWHSWVLSKGVFKQASEMILDFAKRNLPQTL